MIISRSLHVAANGIISFFFMTNIPLYIYGVCVYVYIHTQINGDIYMYIHIHIYHIFIRSFVDGNLGSSYVLPIVNSASVDIGIYLSFQITVLSGYMLTSRISGSYGDSIKILIF